MKLYKGIFIKKEEEVNIGFRYSVWRYMVMYLNKDMNYKFCFFLMKKFSLRKILVD